MAKKDPPFIEVSSKKYTYSLRDYWELSKLTSRKWIDFLSPIAFCLWLLDLGYPTFISSLPPIIEGIVYAGLFVLAFFRLFLFFMISLLYTRQGRTTTLSTNSEKVVLKKEDGPSVEYPLSSLKYYKESKNFLLLTTGKLGALIPKKILTEGELEQLLQYADKKLKKRTNIKTWIQVCIFFLTLILSVFIPVLIVLSKFFFLELLPNYAN